MHDCTILRPRPTESNTDQQPCAKNNQIQQESTESYSNMSANTHPSDPPTRGPHRISSLQPEITRQPHSPMPQTSHNDDIALQNDIQSLRNGNKQLRRERDKIYQRIEVLREQNKRMEEENQSMVSVLADKSRDGLTGKRMKKGKENRSKCVE